MLRHCDIWQQTKALEQEESCQQNLCEHFHGRNEVTLKCSMDCECRKSDPKSTSLIKPKLQFSHQQKLIHEAQKMSAKK